MLTPCIDSHDATVRCNDADPISPLGGLVASLAKRCACGVGQEARISPRWRRHRDAFATNLRGFPTCEDTWCLAVSPLVVDAPVATSKYNRKRRPCNMCPRTQREVVPSRNNLWLVSQGSGLASGAAWTLQRCHRGDRWHDGATAPPQPHAPNGHGFGLIGGRSRLGKRDPRAMTSGRRQTEPAATNTTRLCTTSWGAVHMPRHRIQSQQPLRARTPFANYRRLATSPGESSTGACPSALSSAPHIPCAAGRKLVQEAAAALNVGSFAYVSLL